MTSVAASTATKSSAYAVPGFGRDCHFAWKESAISMMTLEGALEADGTCNTDFLDEDKLWVPDHDGLQKS
ncbi:hypothetical protein PG994_002684 [Apiospora phragmitis]|uniref:Uncharacterized protein n=1 Tax=Apiospora phragmitis TaxID=2905665 RepID=A0ABR1W739_9PEZI